MPRTPISERVQQIRGGEFTQATGSPQPGFDLEKFNKLREQNSLTVSTQNSQNGGSSDEYKTKGFLGKVGDFLGVEKFTRGIGTVINNATGGTDGLEEAQQSGFDIQNNLIEQIRLNKATGKDTSRLEAALEMQNTTNTQTAEDIYMNKTGGGLTSREVIGGAINTAALIGGAGALPGLAGGGAAASSTLGGVGRGLATGAAEGAIFGATTGFGSGLSENKSTKESLGDAVTGAVVGGATGGIIGGAFGGFAQRLANKGDDLLKLVTPEAGELTPTQYKDMLSRGRVTPKTATEPAQVVLTEGEKRVAQKYSNEITKDPVQTAINISDQIGTLDDEVGTFLQKNNGIFNNGELRNSLTDAIQDIDDVTISQDRIQKSKERLVNQFVESLDKNDMYTLWQRRKEFDQQIENAFRGAPSVQKDIKIAFRNAIQDFISKRTPDEVYKGYMQDMSDLFNLRDNVTLKASKERKLDAISKWVKENPKKAKAIGWGTTIYIGNELFNPFGN